MKTNLLPRLAFIALASVSTLNAADPPNGTLLFENLRKLSSSFRIENPSVPGVDLNGSGNGDGPKGLATADLNGDGRKDLVTGNTDGSVAVLFGGAGGGFEPVIHLQAGSPTGLRDVICANVTGDARPEIIAAHPFDGKLYIFSVTGGVGSRVFTPAQAVTTWPGARSVAAGDFNGDGKTDLTVAGAGGTGGSVQEFRGNGAGAFTLLPPIAAIDAATFDGESSKPVFTLHAWRHPGETRDRLVVSFAGAPSVWFLNSPAVGQPLGVSSIVAISGSEYGNVYDLTTGYFSAESRVSGEPDLVTAETHNGQVFVRRFTAGATPYPTVAQQSLQVPGGPRGMSVADVNGDGWPDLLVASRNGNTLHLFLNNAGVLTLATAASTGASPRDVVAADFDGNGMPDAAVINRDSQDITVHRIDPATGCFLVSPLVQSVPGGASAVAVRDLDGNGRPELFYLNPTTGDAAIHQFTLSGGLVPAVRYSMGARPQSLSAGDINGDGRLDLLTTTIGDPQNPGGLFYRLQNVDHSFGPLTSPPPPPEPLPGGIPMLASISADFDGDGIQDRAALFYDCRIALYRGTATGFAAPRIEFFIYESRALVALDLDGDGDLDLVGVGAVGDLAVVKNNGEWFTGGAFLKTDIARNGAAAGAYLITAKDDNNDGYQDLTIASKTAISRWNGGPDLTFTFLDVTSIPSTTSIAGGENNAPRPDYDGDGSADTFALCPADTTASFFSGALSSQWWTQSYVPYSVPSSSVLGSGDIDGDGRPDLVGVGEYLWVALSGTPAPALVPTAVPPLPPGITSVVINEVLASTEDYIAPGATGPVDCVEIYNGGAVSVDLANWKLRRVAAAGDTQMPDFTFPAYSLAPGARTVIYCNSNSGPWQAPFKLPEEGATLQLLTATGAESDSLTYNPQQPDVSYSRLSDSSTALVYNPLPSIGAANYDNGNTDPVISFKGVDLAMLKNNQWRFRANAWSAGGMFTLIITWREITAIGTPRTGTIPLYDDGLHNDGGSLDGDFAGDWDAPLPPGTAIEFYITGTDLRGESATEPGGQEFATSGRPVSNYTLSIPVAASGLEISEVVSRNQGGLRDEVGNTPDWMEIRYTGAGAIPVADLFLSDSLFGYDPGKLYDVSGQGASISTGGTLLIFLDGTAAGVLDPRHANFKVDGGGDTIYLFRRLASGATELVDWVKVPELEPDVAYARIGVGGEFTQTTPTPGAPNVRAGGALSIVAGLSGDPECMFVFSGAGRVEASFDLKTWIIVMPSVPDDGAEHIYREPKISPQRFFRVR